MAELSWQLEGPPDAPVIVVLHPIATHRGLWASQAAVWSTHWRVLGVDLPGHGSSLPPAAPMSLAEYADGVARMLDILQVPTAALVGLSFGGMVAQAFAVRYPGRVAALVLAHTMARTSPTVREIWQRRLELFEREGMGSQVQSILDRWFTRDFSNSSPLTLDWVGKQILSTSPKGYVSAVKAIQSLDYMEQLRSVEAPALVIAGEADTAVPPETAAVLASCIPRATLKVVAGAAHISNVEQPREFTELVGGFIRSCMD